MTHPDPQIDALPSLADVAPAYDALLELAAERLDGPVQTRLETWEDGEFQIRIYHGYGPHPQRPQTTYHHVLSYHDREGLVEALLAVDIETVEKTLICRESVDTDGVLADASRAPAKK